MKKKKKLPKYYVAQVGATTGMFNNPNQFDPNALSPVADTYQFHDMRAAQVNPNLLPMGSPINTDLALNSNRPFSNNPQKPKRLGMFDERRTELNPFVKGFNTLAQIATGVASSVNNVSAGRNELAQYLKALQPESYENMERYGLNSNPVFTKYGGGYQAGGLTKGLIATPRYLMSHPSPTASDTTQYENDFENMRALNPNAVYQFNQYRNFGVPAGLSDDSYKYATTQRNAYNDAYNPNTWKKERVEQELNRPVFKPKDIMKKQVGGGTEIGDPYYEANATLSYYKNKLNDKLKAKNPEAFGNYFQGLANYRKVGDTTGSQKYIQDTQYNEYLSPDEVKGTLGDADYQRYLNSLKTVNGYNIQQGKQPLYGQTEGEQDVTNLNYGRRFASLQVTPTYALTNKTTGANYNRQYNYNPSTQKVDFSETGDLSIRPPIFGGAQQAAPQTGAAVSQGQAVSSQPRALSKEEAAKRLEEAIRAGDTGGFGSKQQYGGEYKAGGWIQKAINPAHKGYCTPMSKSTCTGHRRALALRFKNGDLHRQTGGMGEIEGLPNGLQGLANVNAERGEVVEGMDGQYSQIPDDANTHEQGGEMLPQIQRVLENTSNLRKDKASKYLKIDPKQFKALTGLDTSKSMSHAEAMVKAEEGYEKQRDKIVGKIELAGRDRQYLDKYGEASTKLNIDHFKAIPTQKQMFERLFNHQEAVKANFGIMPDGTMSKYGGVIKAQLGAYSGNKSGLKTPAGNSDAFPQGNTLDKYLADLKARGFNYEGIGQNRQLQSALYDYVLQTDPERIKKMWQEGMHQAGMQGAKKLGFVDEKGRFKQGILDNPENLKKLGEIYPDNILGVRTLQLAAPPKKPRVWMDEPVLPDTPGTPKPVDTSIKGTRKLVQNPQSNFNEPLKWYDTASSIGTYLSALERLPEKYNPAEFHQLRYKLQDPTATLQQNQGDFNAAIQATQNTSPSNAGVQAANIANLASQKYSMNNQVLGQYENQNAQIKNQEILYNTQVRDKQSVADQQARELFEEKVLTGKAKQQEQKLTALDSLYKTIAENRALNRNGNLIMKFSRAFDQYGEYNGYQQQFQVNPQYGVGYQNPTSNTKFQPAGGVQGLTQGKSYYNRRSGKVYRFDGGNLVEVK